MQKYMVATEVVPIADISEFMSNPEECQECETQIMEMDKTCASTSAVIL